jgi:hypothetical protein
VGNPKETVLFSDFKSTYSNSKGLETRLLQPFSSGLEINFANFDLKV